MTIRQGTNIYINTGVTKGLAGKIERHRIGRRMWPGWADIDHTRLMTGGPGSDKAETRPRADQTISARYQNTMHAKSILESSRIASTWWQWGSSIARLTQQTMLTRGRMI